MFFTRASLLNGTWIGCEDWRRDLNTQVARRECVFPFMLFHHAMGHSASIPSVHMPMYAFAPNMTSAHISKTRIFWLLHRFGRRFIFTVLGSIYLEVLREYSFSDMSRV